MSTNARIQELREELESLRERVTQRKVELQSATGDERSRLGFWIWGAGKHEDRILGEIRHLTNREHRFLISEYGDEFDDEGPDWEPTDEELDAIKTYAICSCGARILGRIHYDFTFDEFPGLPGHLNFD